MTLARGTWSKLFESIHTHPKTAKAAAYLIANGVPHACAPAIVVCAVHRLGCWAIRDGETGRTGGLTDVQFAAIAWPEHAEAGISPEVVRKSLQFGGQVECKRGVEHIHDFGQYFSEIIRKRLKTKDSAVAGPSPDGRPTVARPAPRARVSGSGSGSGTKDPPNPPQAGGPIALARPTRNGRIRRREEPRDLSPSTARVLAERGAAIGLSPGDVDHLAYWSPASLDSVEEVLRSAADRGGVVASGLLPPEPMPAPKRPAGSDDEAPYHREYQPPAPPSKRATAPLRIPPAQPPPPGMPLLEGESPA